MGESLGLSRWAQLIPETVKERQVDESWRCDPRTTHHLKRKEGTMGHGMQWPQYTENGP